MIRPAILSPQEDISRTFRPCRVYGKVNPEILSRKGYKDGVLFPINREYGMSEHQMLKL
jgi:hypothetical protein